VCLCLYVERENEATKCLLGRGEKNRKDGGREVEIVGLDAKRKGILC
jgi:hypothetical protein